MKFGVREICDVVLRAKSAQKIGNKVFYKNEPVIYFDSLKTSTLESSSTTVYAQGGRGNARLIAWEGERTVTFTMEDALISPMGFSILTGAGLIDAKEKPVIIHKTEQVKVKSVSESEVVIELKETPYIGGDGVNNFEDFIYVILLDENGEVCSEPYIAVEKAGKEIKIMSQETENDKSDNTLRKNDLSAFSSSSIVLVDYYVAKESGAFQINITPDKFGGNFYLEASTLFRSKNGVDMPAEFIIPNCKIQSNFTFTMASSGDPSTFTFTIDAFPDYTRWDKTKKVFAAIQVIKQDKITSDFERLGTAHNYKDSTAAEPYRTYMTTQKDYVEEDNKEEIQNLIFTKSYAQPAGNSSIFVTSPLFNNDLGYLKESAISLSSGRGITSGHGANFYCTTGCIPYQGEQINIAGFKEDLNESLTTSQGIAFYRFENNNSGGPNGIVDKNVLGFWECKKDLLNSITTDEINSTNFKIIGDWVSEDLDSLTEEQKNTLIKDAVQSADYIRVCFFNNNINEIEVTYS